MTDPQPGAAERITTTITAWPGITTGPHRFGGLEFRLGRRELGHLHGHRVADLPFPRRVRDELIADGHVERRSIPASVGAPAPLTTVMSGAALGGGVGDRRGRHATRAAPSRP